MLQHYIIDGYNLIHTIPHLKKIVSTDTTSARNLLANLIIETLIKKKIRCTVVFDGHQPSDQPLPSYSLLSVEFASPFSSADIKIKHIIEYSKNRSHLVIVSSDQEIARFARVCSCSVYTSQEFASFLLKKESNKEEKKETSLSKREIDEWLKIFTKKE